MNKPLALFSIILLLLINISITQAQNQENRNIENAIRTGNSQQLSEYFNNNIQLKIENKNNVYSKIQAYKIINNFFEQHKPVSYQVNSEKQRGDSKVILGNINTETITYRIIYRLVPTNGKNLITYMEIDTI